MVVDTGAADPAETGVATSGDGIYVNSGELDGLTGQGGRRRADHRPAGGGGRGGRAVNYRLRDWLLSRQRYWGCPIPIIHCADVREVPVPDEQLPVELPRPDGHRSRPQGNLAAGRRPPTG